MNKLVECNGISAGYGKKKVLDQVSFSLEAGSKVAVLGPNGCGKSTLMKVLTGMLPYQGTARISDQEIRNTNREKLSRQVTLMSQFHSMAYPYIVFETVMMGRFVHFLKGIFRGPADRDKERVKECISAVGLEGLDEVPVTELSGGQQQRVFLARALVQETPLILLDEPTSHLDLKYQIELIDYLNKWNKLTGSTIVSVMHDLALAIRFADKVMLMKEGRVEAFGRLSEVLEPGVLPSVFSIDIVSYYKQGIDILLQAENCRDKIDDS